MLRQQVKDCCVSTRQYAQVPPIDVRAAEIPESSVNGYGLSHFAGSVHVLSVDKQIRVRDMSDGTSNTIMAGEVSAGFRPWADPDNLRDPGNGSGTTPEMFAGPSPGVTQFLMSDGSVHAITNDIDPAVLQALATPAGGETVGNY